MGSINSKALKASYLLSLHIPKTRKPHSLGENLFLSAIKDVVEAMFGNKLLKNAVLIPLSMTLSVAEFTIWQVTLNLS
jgi:uncharacterized membrane protein YhfC